MQAVGIYHTYPIITIISRATGYVLNRTNTDLVLEQSDEAHRQVYGEQHHESHLSHELIAGAASFAGMKAWEDHQRKEGMYRLLHNP